MAKLTNSQAALTHTKAFIFELLYKHYEEQADQVDDILNTINTVAEFKRFMENGKIGEYYISRMLGHHPVMDFYKAMTKVCPVLQKTGSPEHTGTEDRGWWRVFGAIKNNDGYFCEMDLGRDQWMAETFYNTGVITVEEYAAYKTNMTLKMMGRARWQTNGFPDAAKIRNYWKPNCQEQVLDMRLIGMLEAA